MNMVSKQIKKHTIQWVLAIPTIVLISFVWLFLLMQLYRIIVIMPSSRIGINFWFILGGGSTAIVWVFTTYFIVPSYKMVATWVSYLIGLVIVLLITPPWKMSISNPWALSSFSAIICGLLFALFIQYKNSRKHIYYTENH